MAEAAVPGAPALAEPSNLQHLTATHVGDINVRTSDEHLTCGIQGMAAISHDKIVAADYTNGTIKLIDTVHSTVISEFTPEVSPYDVTVCNDTIAATLQDAKKIVFLKYENGLVRERDIEVDGSCQGIHWYDGKLYVVFDEENTLEVMTTAGVVQQRITNPAEGVMFDNPEFVAVGAESKRIYVSNWYTGTLIVLDLDGRQTGKYEDGDSELFIPRQVAVDARTGALFLCDSANGTVHLLSPDGEKVKILLPNRFGGHVIDSEDAGSDFLYSVCYCDDTRRLYVALGDNVAVYQISQGT